MYVTIMSIMNAKKTSFIFELRIESKHRCIKYHQWRAKQKQCVIIKQHKHSLRVYLNITRWIEVIDSLLNNTVSILLFQLREAIV